MADRFDGGVLQWGADDLAFGDDLLGWGEPLTALAESTISRLKPEQVIVAACRSIAVQAFPVFEIGEPTLPSVVFASVSAVEQTAFQRILTEQIYAVTCRAKKYSDCIMLAEYVYQALRKFPSNRVRGIVGFSDGYAEPNFEFRTRIMQVTIQR